MTTFLVTLEPSCPSERAEQIKDAVRMVRGVVSVDGKSEAGDTDPEALTSIDTFQIAGRGTVKVVSTEGLRRKYNVGDDVRIDGQDWTIRGIEMSLAIKPPTVGLIVRAKTDARASIAESPRPTNF